MLERFYSIFFLGCVCVLMSHFPQRLNSKEKPKVIVFFSLECPICQKYVPELNRIYNEYSSRIAFEVIIPEKSEGKLISKFVSEYNVNFTIDIDKKRRTRTLNPEVTPEVFLFDAKGRLVYQGAIDNWFYELGNYRSEPTEFYLRNALESLLHGEVPKVVRTKAIGCIISTHSKDR
jgi:thiol-disulfide isomerase/thioredoxin